MVLRRPHAAAMLLVLVLATGCGAAEPASQPEGRSKVVVPDVVGQARSRASCALVGAGLRWRGGGERVVHADTMIPCGDAGVGVAPDPPVRRQRPAAGRRVPPGTVVVMEDECTLLRFRSHGGACS